MAGVHSRGSILQANHPHRLVFLATSPRFSCPFLLPTAGCGIFPFLAARSSSTNWDRWRMSSPRGGVMTAVIGLVFFFSMASYHPPTHPPSYAPVSWLKLKLGTIEVGPGCYPKSVTCLVLHQRPPATPMTSRPGLAGRAPRPCLWADALSLWKTLGR